MKPKKGK